MQVMVETYNSNLMIIGCLKHAFFQRYLTRIKRRRNVSNRND